MATLLQDLRYALRMLAKAPAFTAVAVLTLALGIGGNTSIFTLIDAAMLKTLPVENPHQLVLFDDSPDEGTMEGEEPGQIRLFSYPLYKHLRDHNDSFTGLAAFRSGEDRLAMRISGDTSRTAAEEAWGHLVSGNYFEVMRVKALLGRTLTPEDDLPSARPVAVINYRLWQRRFNRDPTEVGRQVFLNGDSFTVVGVTPPEFFGERVRRPPDLWIPVVWQPQVTVRQSYLNDPKVWWLNLMGRLRPGTSLEQARAHIDVLLRQFLTEQAGAQISSDTRRRIQQAYVSLAPGARGISYFRLRYSEPLHILMVVAALVLLIACANVASLMLARGMARQQEISVRMALGASRARLVRQLLTESVLLAAVGGGVGILLARWVTRALVSQVAPSAPLDVSMDSKVLAFTLAVSLATGVVFGTVPAIFSSQVELTPTLKGSTPSFQGGRLRSRAATTLVASQVALSLVLLVGAGLLTRSLVKLEGEQLGFNRENLLLIGVDPALAGYKPTELPDLYRRLLDRLSDLPGIRSVTVVSHSPMSGHSHTSNIGIQGHTPRPGEDMDVKRIAVGPKFCETLGLPLLLGREVGPQDTASSPQVAMVNKAFADYFFPNRNPIGHKFGFGDDPKHSGDIEIVGVVGDARFYQVKQPIPHMVYLAMLQTRDTSAFLNDFELRTAGDPSVVIPEARQAIGEIDHRLPITNVTTLSRQVAESFEEERMIATLSGLFGLLALLLALTGLFGVLSHTVARRTKEIGIRMALGAERGDILWMVLRETLVMVVIGLAIGVPAALAASQLIASSLYGIKPYDPFTLAAAALVLTGVAALAGSFPARRASRVDPMVALRYE